MVVLKKIRRLRFAYFGSGSDNFKDSEEPTWQNEWIERKVLPRLVSIDVELMNGDIWPTLVIALKIGKISGGTNNDKAGAASFGIVGGKFINP